MLRSKLKKLAGKEEPEVTGEEEEEVEDTSTEVKTIKMLNYIRNEFIAKGWVGCISMSRESMLSAAEYDVEVGAGATQVTEPPFAYEKESDAGTPLIKVTKRLLNQLEKKAHAWRNVPYRNDTALQVSMSLPLGPLTFCLEIRAEVESVLASSAAAAAAKKASETSAL
mmetsp:Transcript_7/g.9  ORF Transcript_7/g.9 Transcript_7/m.9 type:complete len:168 (-) Transcript_7:263-766(-)